MNASFLHLYRDNVRYIQLCVVNRWNPWQLQLLQNFRSPQDGSTDKQSLVPPSKTRVSSRFRMAAVGQVNSYTTSWPKAVKKSAEASLWSPVCAAAGTTLCQHATHSPLFLEWSLPLPLSLYYVFRVPFLPLACFPLSSFSRLGSFSLHPQSLLHTHTQALNTPPLEEVKYFCSLRPSHACLSTCPFLLSLKQANTHLFRPSLEPEIQFSFLAVVLCLAQVFFLWAINASWSVNYYRKI